ncbi:MAG: hypothetical protein NVSMB3_05980 [Acidobacteriaceae bacterium]
MRNHSGLQTKRESGVTGQAESAAAGKECLFRVVYPGRVFLEMSVTEISRERTKLLNRVRRMRGQVDAVERALQDGRDCHEVLMQLAAVRGGINSLMGEVMEDHIRLHLLQGGDAPLTPDLGEELIDLVRAYLK